jgi:hypothetical protein
LSSRVRLRLTRVNCDMLFVWVVVVRPGGSISQRVRTNLTNTGKQSST